MVKFNVKLNAYYYLLISLGAVIGLAGVGLNIYNVIAYAEQGFLKILPYILLALVSLVIAVIIFSPIKSYYKLTEEYFICAFGLFKNKIDIKSISEIISFQKENKLIVYYGENKYINVLLAPDKFSDFTSSLIKLNTQISYSLNITSKNN